MPTRTFRATTLLLFLFLFPHPTQAQVVRQSRGLDQRVDYAALTQYGPWDDRNYDLTQEDLALLAPDEAAQTEAIPAFFRVQLRKNIPGLRRSGPAQYPRSALPVFLKLYGGYLIDGVRYRRATRADGRWTVQTTGGIARQAFAQQQAGAFAEARVTSPNGAAESAVAINPVNSSLVIAGTNGPGFAQLMHVSTDGGLTWTQAAALPGGNTCCDPTVGWSSDGTRAYTATLGGCGGNLCNIWFYRSGDGGLTWTDLETDTPGDPRRELTSAGNSDKEYLHVDTFPGSPFLDNIYLTWHDSNVMQFAVSSDFGNTWTIRSFPSTPGNLGIGSDITTDKSGNVYYFWPAFNSQRILVARSTNGGASFTPPVQVTTTQGSFAFPIPSIETREAFIYVSADVDRTDGLFADRIYAAWTDATAPTGTNPANNHARIQVAHSSDGGATWTVVTPHETADANTVDRWHPWLAVSPDGIVHVIFYDTRNDPTRTSVDLYHAESADGGLTFGTPERITSVTSPNITDTFEFGDYNGLDAAANQLVAVWTDNRDEDGGGGNDIDVYAALTNTTTLPVELTALTATADGADLVLAWETATETNNAGFEVERKVEGAFETLAFVPGAGTTTETRRYTYRLPDAEPGRHTFRLRQVDFDGTAVYSPEVEVTVTLARAYRLTPAYPNPFNPQTTFTLSVQRDQPVRVEVVDLLGRRVALLHEGPLEGNRPHRFTLDGSALSSGPYLIRARGTTFSATEQVTLVK